MNRLKDKFTMFSFPVHREVRRSLGFLLFGILTCIIASCSTDGASNFGLETSEHSFEGEEIVVNFTVNDIAFGESTPVTRSFTNPIDGFYFGDF